MLPSVMFRGEFLGFRELEKVLLVDQLGVIVFLLPSGVSLANGHSSQCSQPPVVNIAMSD